MDSKRIPALSVFLFLTDLGLVLIGMFVSSELRSNIPLGAGGALPAERTQVPPPVYLLALICWGIGLVSSGAYNPQRVLRWFNETWRLAWGSGVGTVLMAGVLFMSYRELSRLQFVYFFAFSLGLLLSYPGGLRVYYRVAGKARPGGQSRVLVLGAGELGERSPKSYWTTAGGASMSSAFLTMIQRSITGRSKDFPRWEQLRICGNWLRRIDWTRYGSRYRWKRTSGSRMLCGHSSDCQCV